MGLIEEIFEHAHAHREARMRDVQRLGETLGADTRQLAAHLQRLETENATLSRAVDRLQLVCNALAEVLVQSELVSREGLEVLVQQIDLLDGVEDGKLGPTVRAAPRCHACGHAVNPAREACIYCETPIVRTAVSDGGPYRGGPPPEPAPAIRMRTARCDQCGAEVPQGDTYFTDDGTLQCSICFAGEG